MKIKNQRNRERIHGRHRIIVHKNATRQRKKKDQENFTDNNIRSRRQQKRSQVPRKDNG